MANQENEVSVEAQLAHWGEVGPVLLAKHRQDDPIRLALKKFEAIPARIISLQVEARQKLAKKLPTWVANDSIYFPLHINQEQASSEVTALFKTTQWSWVQANISKFDQVFDLTVGMGVDSWAWANAGLKVKAFEIDQTLAAITAYNLKCLNADVIVHSDALTDFDLITPRTLVYIDPDRRPSGQKREFGLTESEPDVVKLVPTLLERGATIIIKASPMLDLKLAINQLQNVTTVLAISWRGDCRELVLVCEPQAKASINYTSVEIGASGQLKHFEVLLPLQKLSLTKPANIAAQLGNYLYQPGPSINKLHLADELARHYSLQKLHPATWLYTSDQYLAEYPGRVFEVLEVCQVETQAVHQAIKQYDIQSGGKLRAHVLALNIPSTSEKMAKQLKVTEGGSLQVFIATLANGLYERPVAALICRQL